MERIVLEEFVKWKESARRKPLIVNGARQVGKSWLLREFARRYYAKEAYLVCRKNDLLGQLFAQDFDVERILRGLRALSGVDITPGDTLIVLDEVQEIPEAIESLKYFCEQAPEYHIAVAGSLLGVSLHSGLSFPVGKADSIHVYPMSFEEFLLAKGEDEAVKLLAEKDWNTITLLHSKYVDLLRQYYYVGGMPEAVRAYVTNGGLGEVRRIQESIVSGYERDFSKHAPAYEVPRIRMVWESIPSQLFKENKKFAYANLKKGARAKEYELAIEWLIDSGLLHRVPRCTKPELPLDIYRDPSAFKLYLVDVGLLGAMVHTDPAQVLVKTDFFTEYKGGMTEQYVLQQMKSKGISPIYYHSASDSRLEIDFLLQRGAKMLPIEVKAERNVRSNSLSNLLNATEDLTAERYSMLPYCRQGKMTNIPLYAV